ncbi:hypothetical protein ACMFMF_006340 [Clarireedia jacksonii]
MKKEKVPSSWGIASLTDDEDPRPTAREGSTETTDHGTGQVTYRKGSKRRLRRKERDGRSGGTGGPQWMTMAAVVVGDGGDAGGGGGGGGGAKRKKKKDDVSVSVGPVVMGTGAPSTVRRTSQSFRKFPRVQTKEYDRTSTKYYRTKDGPNYGDDHDDDDDQASRSPKLVPRPSSLAQQLDVEVEVRS